MRVAIFADVHGNIQALEAVLEDARANADMMVCAGDLAWGGPHPAEAIERIRALGVPCVVGNTDLSLVSDRALSDPWGRWMRDRVSREALEFIESLPGQHDLDGVQPPPPDGAGRLLVVHSVPGHPAAALPHPSQTDGLERLFGGVRADVVVHGHDHHASIRTLSRITVVGTGSVGMPFDGDPRAAYALATFDPARREWRLSHRRVAYDVEKAASEAERAGFPGAMRWSLAIRRGMPPQATAL